ncbi:MAG: hypothetical protein JXA94_05985 [Parachlamydiales bacterium]|nr:hypothetical protein [Parachlamydiales bacterium]
MKKIFLFLIFLFSFTLLIAENCCPPTPCECEPAPCCEIPMQPTINGYNTPANINVCGPVDAFISATLLWWEASQDQMELGTQTFPSNEYGRLIKCNFEWKPAFKVALGYNIDYDNWVTLVQYTRWNGTTNTSKSLSENGTLNDLWFGQTLPTLSKISQKWKLDFNIFDLEFTRPFYNGTKLTLSPQIGLKSGWISQEIDETVTSLSDNKFQMSLQSKSWLVGPKVGLYSNFLVGNGFRFFGNFAGSLFYQRFNKLKLTEPDVTDTSTLFNALKYSNGFINPSFECIVGIGYGKYFARNNWHFDVFAGYETQIYFSQNMNTFLNITKNSDNTISPGNLMFQGLTLSMQFDF